jgi:4-amino-4-deoxychorismate lyase
MQSIVLNLDGDVSEFDLRDRGLAYGDGLFETILIHQAQPIWWDAHWQRLLIGAQRLHLPAPNQIKIRKACEALMANQDRAVLKIMYTRGSGGRGYAVPEEVVPRILLSAHPAPKPIPNGIHARWCTTRLAIQPALAGIKHLNRLEQVLARSEWNSSDIHEGVMCDTDGRVICATSANIFIRRQGQWLTPTLDRCGITGVTRAWVLENSPHSLEAHLSCEDVMHAEAVFLCNAVHGIMPVLALDERIWAAHPDILALQYALAQAQPAFVLGEIRGT